MSTTTKFKYELNYVNNRFINQTCEHILFTGLEIQESLYRCHR